MTIDELRAGVEKSGAYQQRLAAECRAQLTGLRDAFEANEKLLLSWITLLEGHSDRAARRAKGPSQRPLKRLPSSPKMPLNNNCSGS
jgi:hypothetical protein